MRCVAAQLRALVDCVLVGVGTVVADRPRLTVRRVTGPHPVRAVLDPRGRAPDDVSPLAPEADAPPTLHLVGASCIDRLPAPAAHVPIMPSAHVQYAVRGASAAEVYKQRWTAEHLSRRLPYCNKPPT